MYRQVSAGALLLATLASAAARADSDEPLVETHGFVSQGYLRTTDNNWLAADSSESRGSFRFSEAGINFTRSFTDDLRAGIQLFARQLGPTGNFSAKLDWFYLDYRYADWLGIRAGRVKVPFGLYNEYQDIDSANVPILLPQSIYPLQNRDFLLAQSGGEIYGYLRLGKAGAVEYRAYRGTITLDVTNTPGNPAQLVTLDIPYVGGARVIWETPLPGLRVGGTVQALRLDFSELFGAQLVTFQLPAVLWLGSAEYALRDWLFSAEYSRWIVDLQSSTPALFPNSHTVSERGYVMASYRVRRWFQPGAYYSLLFPDVNAAGNLGAPRAQIQLDAAATLRFDINEWWLVKLEGHFMRGTAGLDPTLNGNLTLDKLAPTWGAFLVKTTVHF